MCRSMVNIQSLTAEIRHLWRFINVSIIIIIIIKKKKKKKKKN